MLFALLLPLFDVAVVNKIVRVALFPELEVVVCFFSEADILVDLLGVRKLLAHTIQQAFPLAPGEYKSGHFFHCFRPWYLNFISP